MLLQAALALAVAAPGRCTEVLALSDLHGRVADLPRVAAALRPVRERGPSLLLDAGDGLQGTLEARLSRGEAVVAAYAALGVDAAAVGNHDFDHGTDVLRQRVAGAPYPFLAANVVDDATGRHPAWENLAPARILRPAGGPAVGVFGLAAPETPQLTMPGNVRGLSFTGATGEAVRQAKALRRLGAEIVVGVAHLGGHCQEMGDPRDLSSCEPDADLFRLARAMPEGLVDALVGGHTHGWVNHLVNGVAVVQAGARAEAVAWVTLCAGEPPRFHAPIRPRGGGKGDGEAVDARVAAAVAPWTAAAEAERQRPLGVRLERPLGRSRKAVSPFGAAAAQAVRAALGADFGLVNAGGLRLDLPAGDLRHGQVYEAIPFDDDLALARIPGALLADLLRTLARGDRGFPQVAGLLFDGREARTCDGKPLAAERLYTLALNEFLARGGDGVRPVIARLPADALSMREDLQLRDAFVAWLRTAPPARVGEPCP